MVAYRGADTHILKGWEKQELLLIRSNIEPVPKAGDPECRVIPEMCEEIKAMLSDLHLIDAEGRVMRQNESDGTTRAQVSLCFATAELVVQRTFKPSLHTLHFAHAHGPGSHALD